MARQAIRKLIDNNVKIEPKETYLALATTRDGLAHGRSSESIEKEVGRSLADLVDLAGTISWHATMSCVPAITQPLTFAHRDGQFVSRTLVVGPVGTFEHDGSSEQPSEDKIPSVKISMEVTFRDPTGSEA